MNKGNVWVVDDDSSIRWVLEKTLSGADINCETFTHAEALLDALSFSSPDAIISDIRMSGMSGMELLDVLQSNHPDIPVIIMTAHSDLDAAVNAYQQGAFEYLPKPFDIEESVTLIERALEHSKKHKANTTQTTTEVIGSSGIIGEAPAMQEVFRVIGRLARSSISVLIHGESGTGKELVAQALHLHSPRKTQPFIALNMAAIPKDLIESELFGHDKGAFTGANAARQGRFEQANGGTLFLDEIGDMPLDIQTRLLRVLSDGQFYRVGGTQPIQVNVRIVAATHQNLDKNVQNKTFREDLFHRLNVIKIQVPALRDRKQDIQKLCQHFLQRAARDLAVEEKHVPKDIIMAMQDYHWPGNVRQLENVCQRLTVMASSESVHIDDLPDEIKYPSTTQSSDSTNSDWHTLLQEWAQQEMLSGKTELISDVVPCVEKALLEMALRHTNGHKQDAAKILGWGRNTLTRKLKELSNH
ncbi:nitrogen regulation protein NR(I) [Vibrio sp.]|nr:nitrogen regulation protein NR(I) [Vibrio sp.]